jgi:hypothetical protein
MISSAYLVSNTIAIPGQLTGTRLSTISTILCPRNNDAVQGCLVRGTRVAYRPPLGFVGPAKLFLDSPKYVLTLSSS